MAAKKTSPEWQIKKQGEVTGGGKQEGMTDRKGGHNIK